MRTMREEWEDYRQRIVPKDAHPIQIQETRRAFYAGAWAYRSVNIETVVAGLSEEACKQVLVGLDEELKAFAASVGTPQEGK